MHSANHTPGVVFSLVLAWSYPSTQITHQHFPWRHHNAMQNSPRNQRGNNHDDQSQRYASKQASSTFAKTWHPSPKHPSHRVFPAKFYNSRHQKQPRQNSYHQNLYVNKTCCKRLSPNSTPPIPLSSSSVASIPRPSPDLPHRPQGGKSRGDLAAFPVPPSLPPFVPPSLSLSLSPALSLSL